MLLDLWLVLRQAGGAASCPRHRGLPRHIPRYNGWEVLSLSFSVSLTSKIRSVCPRPSVWKRLSACLRPPVWYRLSFWNRLPACLSWDAWLFLLFVPPTLLCAVPSYPVPETFGDFKWIWPQILTLNSEYLRIFRNLVNLILTLFRFSVKLWPYFRYLTTFQKKVTKSFGHRWWIPCHE